MNDDKFWLILWGTVIAGLVAIVITSAFYHNAKNAKVLQATECFQIAALSGSSHTLAI